MIIDGGVLSFRVGLYRLSCVVEVWWVYSRVVCLFARYYVWLITCLVCFEFVISVAVVFPVVLSVHR